MEYIYVWGRAKALVTGFSIMELARTILDKKFSIMRVGLDRMRGKLKNVRQTLELIF
jgi:hypothetical protein